jgi:hypothetical protein
LSFARIFDRPSEASPVTEILGKMPAITITTAARSAKGSGHLIQMAQFGSMFGSDIHPHDGATVTNRKKYGYSGQEWNEFGSL